MTKLSKKTLAKLAHFKLQRLNTITDVIKEMIQRANKYNIRVICDFNEAQFIVSPGMDNDTAYNLWKAETDRQKKQWSKSMRAEVYRREEEAYEKRRTAKRVKVLEMLEKNKIQILRGKSSAFKIAVHENSVDIHGPAAVNFAIAWAVAMQQAFSKGQKIADVAKQLADEVDYEKILGFQYNLAVSLLVRFWKHGEELRRWRNLNTQLGNKGEEANKTKGAVLNPALMSSK